MKLEAGQVAVVTGGASGIGFGLAEAFVQRGLSVVLADVRQDALDGAVGRLSGTDAKVIGVRTDVSDAAQVSALAAEARKTFGRVDLVANNAGVSSQQLTPLWEVSSADWERILDINLWGVINGLCAFTPIFVEQGHGHIVNTASHAGIGNVPYIAPYTAAKHAVVGLSETLSMELAEHAPGVHVTVLSPGWVNTGMAEGKDLPPGTLEVPDVARLTLAAVEADRLHVAPGSGDSSEQLVRARFERLLSDLEA
ncbi:SDR family NAD(P)-dependent oxidoreductase [Streptomyces sp. NPDC096311]|uniref:SDR family NAD(P)-dependent oxidoreductase n=1 Tax=Streptomyces sp. NPDC096311 TaxID=3366083 RepID=UPI00382E8824